MKQYHITGMSCAACSAKVEKAVSAVDGVTSCSVNLLTNSMGVDGTADKDAVIKAVVDAGYGASLKNSAADHVPDSTTDSDDYRNDNETQKMKYKLIASLIPLVPLLYVSMGNMLWDWPLPGFLQNNHLAVGIWELLLTAIIMVINQDFFIRGFKGLVRRSPNMDTLVALGATAAFGYSVYALFAMSDAVMNHDMMLAMKYMDEFYFESAATILTLITVGKMLEARSKGKTTDAIRGLMKLAPKTATLIRNGENVTVPLSQVKVGDRFAVRPGENIPVDGVVVEGSSAVNEASLTGESIPADKGPGDVVSAATTNQSGYLICEATRVGEDTTLSQIIQMVSDAAATKAPISKIADRVSGVFVPVVIIIACITFVVWLLVGREVSFSLARAISVLVISCPCALGLATPVAIMVGNGVGAKNGIMFKTAVSLEETGKAQIIALDKTGTITKGEPTVKLILPEEGFTEEDLLRVALALEEKSEHPLAKAIVAKAEELGLKGEGVSDFQVAAGNGLVGMQN
ncbi:MAG: heavy metal translocating P-type ATPase, partial [Eubacterium sp.]|nr:heavy metal translocating P-type ATPase [Eubacterium sp.]